MTQCWCICVCVIFPVVSAAPLLFPGLDELISQPGHPEELSLALSSLPKVLLCGLAPSTVQSYVRAFNRWHQWASRCQFPPLPAQGIHVSLYLVHLLLSSSSPSPASVAIAGISWLHRLKGFADPTLDQCVTMCHKAAQRLLATPSKKKTALLPGEIQRIIRHFICPSVSLSDLQTTAMIVLGYSAMLRWDELSRLKPSYLSFCDTHLIVQIPSRKNDQFREGHTVYIARSGGDTCPVGLLEHFLKVGAHSPEQPLFCKLGIRRQKRVPSSRVYHIFLCNGEGSSMSGSYWFKSS